MTPPVKFIQENGEDIYPKTSEEAVVGLKEDLQKKQDALTFDNNKGIGIDNKTPTIIEANDSEITAGTNAYKPITPHNFQTAFDKHASGFVKRTVTHKMSVSLNELDTDLNALKDGDELIINSTDLISNTISKVRMIQTYNGIISSGGYFYDGSKYYALLWIEVQSSLSLINIRYINTDGTLGSSSISGSSRKYTYTLIKYQ